MNKQRAGALLLSGVIAVSVFGCSGKGTTENITNETSDSSVATTVSAESPSTTASKIDDCFNAIVNDYFDTIANDYFEAEGAQLINDEITDYRVALGEKCVFIIFEYKSIEGLNVGDQIVIVTKDALGDTEQRYTIAAINGSYVLVASERDDNYMTNDKAPYATPELQAVYEAFVAYKG